MELCQGGRAIPVFPLPNTVLYPRVVLPLYVFEPRYRQLLTEVLDSHGRIAVALARPDVDLASVIPAGIHDVMGVGSIATYETRPDGTSYVLLLGEHRTRVTEWQEGPVYHRAVLESLDPGDSVPPHRAAPHRRRLLDWLEKLTRDRSEDDAVLQLQSSLREQEDLGFLIDFLAHHFLSSPGAKQRVLEELDVLTRARILEDGLEQLTTE